MDVFISTPANMIQVLVCILAIVLVKLYSDLKSIRAARQIRMLTDAYVTKHYRPKMSAIIDLTRSADTILPLLDHLYGLRYDNLQVIIHIKHTAGKYAQPKLSAYRRKKQLKQLKLIKHTKGMTSDYILRRYTAGEFVMYATPDEVFSPHFFTAGARELLNTKIDGLQPQRQIQIDNTLLSAFQALIATLIHILIHINVRRAPSHVKTGVLYRRTALLTKSHTHLQLRYALRNSITAPRVRSWKMLTVPAMVVPTSQLSPQRIVSLGIGLMILLGVTVFIGQSIINLFLLLLVSYVILLTIVISGERNRSLFDKLILVMVAPFSPVVLSYIGVMRAGRKIIHTIQSTHTKLKRRLLLTK